MPIQVLLNDNSTTCISYFRELLFSSLLITFLIDFSISKKVMGSL